MDNHRINLYEIENAAGRTFHYQLVQVVGLDRDSVSDPDRIDRNVNTLAKLVAISEKSPVAIVRRAEGIRLALPAERRLSQTEYHLAPDIVKLVPDGLVKSAHLASLDHQDRHVSRSFLSFELRGQLRGERDLWTGGTSSFFPRKPLNGGNPDRDIELYEGFHFHVRYLENKLFIGIKLAHKYVDAAWAVDAFSEERFAQLKMRMFLYHFGYNWYPVQLLEVTNKTLREIEFIPAQSATPVNLYNYVTATAGKSAPWIRALDPQTLSVRYRSPGRDQHRFAPLALLKLIHRTSDPGAKELHRQSIKGPEERFVFGRHIVEKFFQNQAFLGEPLSVNPNSHSVRPTVFAVPPLEFGQGKVLRVAEQPRNGETPLAEFARSRMNFITDRTAGVAITSPLEPQYILIPRSLDRAIASDITKRLETSVRSFLQTSYRLDPILFDDRSCRTLKHHVDAIAAGVRQANAKHGRGVLILPARAPEDLHNYIKRALRNSLQFQCLDAAKLSTFYHTVLREEARSIEPAPPLLRRLSSYVNFAALGLLIVNRQWAWVLHKSTHYDAYVSFDVLNAHAAFTFFYEGGRHCYTRIIESGQAEKLSRAQVRKVSYEGLRDDLRTVRCPHSILLQRDGRLFGSEWLGFVDAVKQLIVEGLIAPGTVTGGIEIAKKFKAELRLAKEMHDSLENPTIGTALQVAEDEGIVCTTGYPFSIPGTAAPLAVRIVHGNLNLSWVLEDVFRKSLLAWSAPASCLSVPIDLKLCDEQLRSVAAEADDDIAVHGDEVDDAADVA